MVACCSGGVGAQLNCCCCGCCCWNCRGWNCGRLPQFCCCCGRRNRPPGGIYTMRWSTTRTTIASRSRHLLSLFLIGLSNSLHHSLLINSYSCQLIVRQTGELYQALRQVHGESGTVQVGLLLIRVDVV
jgi:hypothetical protein